MLGKHNKYTCRECGKTKRGNYFISETLCKKCASRRRTPIYNPIVEIKTKDSDKPIKITQATKTRLTNQAERETPAGTIDFIFKSSPIWMLIVFWLIGINTDFPPSIREMKNSPSLLLFLYSMFLICWYSILPISIGFGLKYISPRETTIRKKVHDLAKKREAEIEEAKIFYSSPEWKTLRNRIIKEKPHICNKCKEKITSKEDLTTDHIKPRSKFRELALDASNLQILCRSCNSSKGANILY